MAVADYIVVAVIFLCPGLLWTVIFSSWRTMRSIEILAMSFGFSCIAIPLVLAGGAWIGLVVPVWTLTLLSAGCGIVAGTFLAVHLLKEKGVSLETLKASREDVAALIVFVIHSGIVYFYFIKYPVFDKLFLYDPVWHTAATLQIVDSRGHALLQTFEYPLALHFMLSLILRCLKGEPIVVVRSTLAVIESLTCIMVYVTGSRVLQNRLYGFFCTLTYALIMPVGLIHLVNSGTYSNMLANLYTLYAIYLFAMAMKKADLLSQLTLVIIGVALAFSHFSSFIFISFVWVFLPVVYIFFREVWRAYVISSLSLSLGSFSLLLYIPNMIYRISFVLSGRSIGLLPSDAVFGLLYSHIPFLGLTYAFVGLPSFAVLLASCILLFRKSKRSPWYAFIPSLFIYTYVLSLQGENVWRFALYAIFVGIFLVGYFLSKPMLSIYRWASNLSLHPTVNKINSKGILAVLILSLITMGPTFEFVNDVVGDSKSERQLAIYDSMKWAEENTPRDSSFLSVGLLEYTYLPVVANRTFQGDYEIPPGEIYSLSKQNYVDYVAVSTRDERLEAFKSNELFELMFENKYVLIFHIKRAAD